MTNIELNLSFLQNTQEHLKDDKKPYVLALSGLMILTGVRRLFEKEDVYELVKRAQILLPEQKLIDRFFKDDNLFSFQFEKLTYEFSVLHLEELIGLEILDEVQNFTPYAHWESVVSECLNTYNYIVANNWLKGLKLTEFESNVSLFENVTNIDLAKEVPIRTISYTKEQFGHAELLGKTITKEISEDLFTRIREEYPNKIKELELRRMPFDEPIFNFDGYPIETQKAIWKQFWPNLEHFDDADYRRDYIKLIHLAWLWSNGFVVDELEVLPYVDSRIENFNLDDYELEDGGTNLYVTYDHEGLKDLAPLLYDPEVAKLAARPWESLDIYERVTKSSKA